MYSQDKIDIALQVYHQCGSVTETIRVLGYPTRRALYTWIENEGMPKSLRKEAIHVNTAGHPRNPFQRRSDTPGQAYMPGGKNISVEVLLL